MHRKNIVLRLALVPLLLCVAVSALAIDPNMFGDADVFRVGWRPLHSDPVPSPKTTALGLVWQMKDRVASTHWVEIGENGDGYEVARTDGILFWAEDTLWKLRVEYDEYQSIDCEYVIDKEAGRPAEIGDRWTAKRLPKYTMIGLAGVHEKERRPLTGSYEHLVEFMTETPGNQEGAQAIRGDILTVGLSVHGMVAGNVLTSRCAYVDGCGAREFTACDLYVGEQGRNVWDNRFQGVLKELQFLYEGNNEKLYTENLLYGECVYNIPASADTSWAAHDDVRVQRVETIVHKGKPAIRYLLTNAVGPACTDQVWGEEYATHEVIASSVPSLGLPEVPAWVERPLRYSADGAVYGWSAIDVPPNTADYLDAFIRAE